jgi:hypothetical protein
MRRTSLGHRTISCTLLTPQRQASAFLFRRFACKVSLNSAEEQRPYAVPSLRSREPVRSTILRAMRSRDGSALCALRCDCQAGRQVLRGLRATSGNACTPSL